VYVATVYDGPAKDMVWQLKFQGAQTAAQIMARQMTRVLVKDEPACVVPVPTATGRVRRRGYDQARLLARQLARRGHLPYVEVLKRQGQAHQVGANREQRLWQLQTAFRACNLSAVRGRRLILVDDVVTTGATLEAAAAVLRAAGARRVDAVTFAQPQKRKAWGSRPAIV
jgi:ComF family protein